MLTELETYLKKIVGKNFFVSDKLHNYVSQVCHHSSHI